MNMLPTITPSQARLPRTYEAAEKAEWVAASRMLFSPGPRKACSVCGQWRGIAQAHHVFPLAEQFDEGRIEPDQTFVWLCPNHHAAVHLLMSQTRGKRIAASKAVTSLLCELSDRGEMEALLALAARQISEGAP